MTRKAIADARIRLDRSEVSVPVDVRVMPDLAEALPAGPLGAAA